MNFRILECCNDLKQLYVSDIEVTTLTRSYLCILLLIYDAFTQGRQVGQKSGGAVVLVNSIC